MRDAFTETERARSALWSLDAGADRDSWVRHAMSAKAAGLEFEEFHNWSAGASNYTSEAECRSVWTALNLVASPPRACCTAYNRGKHGVSLVKGVDIVVTDLAYIDVSQLSPTHWTVEPVCGWIIWQHGKRKPAGNLFAHTRELKQFFWASQMADYRLGYVRPKSLKPADWKPTGIPCFAKRIFFDLSLGRNSAMREQCLVCGDP